MRYMAPPALPDTCVFYFPFCLNNNCAKTRTESKMKALGNSVWVLCVSYTLLIVSCLRNVEWNANFWAWTICIEWNHDWTLFSLWLILNGNVVQYQSQRESIRMTMRKDINRGTPHHEQKREMDKRWFVQLYFPISVCLENRIINRLFRQASRKIYNRNCRQFYRRKSVNSTTREQKWQKIWLFRNNLIILQAEIP